MRRAEASAIAIADQCHHRLHPNSYWQNEAKMINGFKVKPAREPAGWSFGHDAIRTDLFSRCIFSELSQVGALPWKRPITVAAPLTGSTFATSLNRRVSCAAASPRIPITSDSRADLAAERARLR
jgi:hypothetical protein